MKPRIIFRVLIAATLAIMYFARRSGGHMSPRPFLPFYHWFLVSVFVFGAFGLASAYNAIREPHNRSAYLTDVVLAAAWVPYWFANLR
jgi:drug/metabolite transporter (DMT)-like permease